MYSVFNRLGRPERRKNKWTLERINNRKNAKAANRCGDIVPLAQQAQKQQLVTPLSNGECGITFDNMIIDGVASDNVNQGMSPFLTSDNFWDFDSGFGLDLDPNDDRNGQNAPPKVA